MPRPAADQHEHKNELMSKGHRLQRSKDPVDNAARNTPLAPGGVGIRDGTHIVDSTTDGDANADGARGARERVGVRSTKHHKGQREATWAAYLRAICSHELNHQTRN